MEFQLGYFALFHLFPILDGFAQDWVESLRKNIQSMLEFFKVLILVLHFSYYPLMIFRMMLSAILLSMLMILHANCEQVSDLRQQPWLVSELESDLRDTVDWGRKQFADFNAGKTQLVLFDQSKNSGSIDVKIDGSALEEKSSLKMLGVSFSSQLHWGSYIVSIAKTDRKLEP